MSNLGYHCLQCRPKTGAQSPRPATPEPEQAPTVAITSPIMPVGPVKQEEKSYSVDGVYLSEHGVGTIKDLTFEQPISAAQKAANAARLARNRQLKIKQSHPQMSQLLSVASNTSGTYTSVLILYYLLCFCS